MIGAFSQICKLLLGGSAHVFVLFPFHVRSWDFHACDWLNTAKTRLLLPGRHCSHFCAVICVLTFMSCVQLKKCKHEVREQWITVHWIYRMTGQMSFDVSTGTLTPPEVRFKREAYQWSMVDRLIEWNHGWEWFIRWLKGWLKTQETETIWLFKTKFIFSKLKKKKIMLLAGRRLFHSSFIYNEWFI